MRSARLDLALETGLIALPPEGRLAVYHPVKGDDLSVFPKDRLTVLTGFWPDHDHFQRAGYAHEDAPPYAAAFVFLPRARDLARALLAKAVAATAPGGWIAVDGQKTDGIDSMLKDLKPRVQLSESLSKAHGKIAVFPVTPGLDFSDWVASDRKVEGDFITRPGVFSADGPDRASIMLAAALPAKLGPKVVDLGAGWGYLSRAILEREGVKRLDLVEAERVALDCAALNIQDPRAAFHWGDATQFRPASLVECVVMNPPFHIGRTADPSLGAAFITAARRMMAPDGQLFMVANRHLPYDPVLAEHFLVVEDIGGDGAFRVIRAAKPRRTNR